MSNERIERAVNYVRAKVAAIENLTNTQRAKVLEIASGAVINNHFDPDHVNESAREPNYEGIANLVRSNTKA